MARNSLNLTEIFENDNSRGSLLVEFLQKRKGRMPKLNVFMMPQESNCSFDIQLKRISTAATTEQQHVPSYSDGNENNFPISNNINVVPEIKSTEDGQTPLKNDGNVQNIPISSATDMPLVPIGETNIDNNQNNLQSNTFITKPSNSNSNENNFNQPTLRRTKYSICSSFKYAPNKVSSSDLLRRKTFKRLRSTDSSQKNLMEDIHSSEISQETIEFNPPTCSTPYSNALPSSVLTRSRSMRLSNRESNLYNTHIIKRIEYELMDALNAITHNKTNHSQESSIANVAICPAKATVSQATSILREEMEDDLENNNNAHKTSSSCIIDVLENQQQNEAANDTDGEGEHENTRKIENEVKDKNNKNDKIQIISVEKCRPLSEKNLNNNAITECTSNVIKVPELDEQQNSRFEKAQSHVMNSNTLTPLENNQILINLGNANINTQGEKNSSNIEPLAMQAIQKSNISQACDRYEKIRKLTLNKVPGIPLNGEIYAEELTRLSYNEILDLRKRNSRGEVFKVQNASQTRQSKEVKQKQKELDQMISFELLKRDLPTDDAMELEQSHQQLQQSPQNQSQRIIESESQTQLENVRQEAAVQVEANGTTFEDVEQHLSKILGSHPCGNEYLAPPSPFCDKTQEVQCQKSSVKDPLDRKAKRSARNSKENMSIALQNYMAVSKTIMERRNSSTRHSKRSLYNDINLNNSTLESGYKGQEGSNVKERLLNKSTKHSNLNDVELSDDVIEKETSLLKLLAPPTPYKDTFREKCASSSLSTTSSQVLHNMICPVKISHPREEMDNGDNDAFKKPVGLPPKKKPRKQENPKIAENNCTVELRRSSRSITPNKNFQFVQQLYQQVVDKRMKVKHAPSKSTLRSITSSFGVPSISGITMLSNSTQKMANLHPIQEEEKGMFMTSSGNEQKSEEPVIRTIKDHSRKTATKTKRRKNECGQEHKSKCGQEKSKENECKLSTTSNLNEIINIPKATPPENIETPTVSVLPVTTEMESQNSNKNLKCTRKNRYGKKRKDQADPSEKTKKANVTKLSEKTRTPSPSLPISSSPPLEPLSPLQSSRRNKRINMEPKKMLRKCHSKRQITKQATESLESQSKMHMETSEGTNIEEVPMAISSKQMNGKLNSSKKESKLKKRVIKQSSSESAIATHNEIVNFSEKIDPVASPIREMLNVEETAQSPLNGHIAQTKGIKQKHRRTKSNRRKPSQKIKLTKPTDNNENIYIEEQLQMEQTNQLKQDLTQNKDDLNYSPKIVPNPSPVYHLSKVLDSFCETQTSSKATYSKSVAATSAISSDHRNSASIIPARCRNFKIRIKKLTNLPANVTQNTLATINNNKDNYSLLSHVQQATSSSDPNIDFITRLKTVQETEVFGSTNEIFDEIIISSHSNLQFTPLQGLEYAFYNADANLGYVRFKARQIKRRRAAQNSHLHFVTISGNFCFTAKNRKKILTPGDMVVIPKMVHYEIENLTDDIGILMVIKK